MANPYSATTEIRRRLILIRKVTTKILLAAIYAKRTTMKAEIAGLDNAINAKIQSIFILIVQRNRRMKPDSPSMKNLQSNYFTVPLVMKKSTIFGILTYCGCSLHITRTKSIFVYLNETFKSHVKLGDGKYVKAEGKGNITVQTKGGTSKLIKDVLYVPSLSQNLLSVGQLVENGYMLTFDKDKCTIVDKKRYQNATTLPMASNKVFPFSMSQRESLLKNWQLTTYFNNGS